MTDVEKLTREFSAWKDEQIRHNRYVDDMLENLDENNCSAAFKKYINGAIQANAGFESYAGSDGAMARMFAEFKNEVNASVASITALANADHASIELLTQWKGQAADKIAEIESTALLKTEAASTYATLQGLAAYKTEIENDVDERVTEAISGFEGFATGEHATLRLFTSYYNGQSTTAADIVLEAANGESQIKMNADKISFGDYAYIENENFYVKRLMGIVRQQGYPDVAGQFYLEINSTPQTGSTVDRGGDLFMRDSTITSGNNMIYGITYGRGNTGIGETDTSNSIHFVVNHGGVITPLIGYNDTANTVYPKGNWDFGAVDSVVGLKVYFS